LISVSVDYFLGSVLSAGSHVIRSVVPAGSRIPVVSYDWLACGRWLRNTHSYVSYRNYDWQLVFLFFISGSLVKG